MQKSKSHILIAVGSATDEVCSIGAFARSEKKALESAFEKVSLLEPTEKKEYPSREALNKIKDVDLVFFHAPALHDRKKPWGALFNLHTIKKSLPHAKIISIVHEFSEAPIHWKVRQGLLLKMSDYAIVNTKADFEGVRRLHRKVLRSQLGPTLFREDFFSALASQSLNSEHIQREVLLARSNVQQSFCSLKDTNQWIVHPGLLTPGKGLDSLKKCLAFLPTTAHLIIMGGRGPKERDSVFAETALRSIKEQIGDRMTLIDSPKDEVFKNVLTASDLVLLPYDNGVSERRSSFLSAMSCGANVLTTLGPWSLPMEIPETVFKAPRESIQQDDFTLRTAFQNWEKADPQRLLSNRISNIQWASLRSWERRVSEIRTFLAEK